MEGLKTAGSLLLGEIFGKLVQKLKRVQIVTPLDAG